MNPDNPNDNQPSNSQQQRSYVNSPPSRSPQARQKQTVADIARSQIASIFGTVKETPIDSKAKISPQPQTPNNQQGDPRNNAGQSSNSSTSKQRLSSSSTTDWKTYHSAWQDYYQKYYERYYSQQVASIVKNAQEGSATEQTSSTEHEKQPDNSRKAAVKKLRDDLLQKVESSAKKARKSRHFMPIAATMVVLMVFGFLQYNQILIANVKAYVTPGNIDPQNIIVNPKDETKVGPEPRLIIPKINVDAPVSYDIPIDVASQNEAMMNGVAHFPIPGANSHPGEVGNTVLAGHRTNDVFAKGDYKFIFMQLDKLGKGDIIYANYKGTRYTYVVTDSKVVDPSDVSTLTKPTDKPMMTLVTCTPLGTDLRRILVTAEQVYPTSSKPAPKTDNSNVEEKPTVIPGESSPSILNRLFGG